MKAVFIVGASGAGKTTLAQNLHIHYLRYFGGQAVITVNLDCANPQILTDINVCDLITLEDVMEEYEIGPNGALLFATDFLLKNISWLYEQIEKCAIKRDPSYRLATQKNIEVKQRDGCQLTLIFDLPGQMQLYLQSGSMKSVICEITRKFDMKSCLLQVFDASYIYEVNQFVSICMSTLTTGINFDMPHVSLLNKIDLLKNRRPSGGMLEDYFKVTSLRQMANDLRLGSAPVLQSIEKIVDQYGRVSFAPSSVYIQDLTIYLILHLQKIFGTLEINLYANRQFGHAIKPFLKDFATERLLNNLEAQLFQEEQFDLEAELLKIRAKSANKK